MTAYRSIPTRSAKDLLAVAEDLRVRKVKLSMLNNGGVIDLNSPNGKLFFGMLSVVAEFERDLLSQRIKDGIAAAKRSQWPLQGWSQAQARR